MGEKGEGSGGEGGGKWGERGRELGMGYPPVHPLTINSGCTITETSTLEQFCIFLNISKQGFI